MHETVKFSPLQTPPPHTHTAQGDTQQDVTPARDIAPANPPLRYSLSTPPSTMAPVWAPVLRFALEMHIEKTLSNTSAATRASKTVEA